MAIGLVFFTEGLVLALAPLRVRQLLEALRKLAPETSRLIGLVAVAVGVLLVALARAILG